MSGYLTAWRDKPDTPAGRILKIISEAGDAYHHTEGWCDPYDEDYPSRMDIIEKCVESEMATLEAKLAVRDREVERLRQALLPFALYSTALNGRKWSQRIHSVGAQSISVGAFRDARDAIGEEKRGDEHE